MKVSSVRIRLSSMRHKLKKDLRKRHEYRRQEEEKLMKRIVKNNQILGGEIRERADIDKGVYREEDIKRKGYKNESG